MLRVCCKIFLKRPDGWHMTLRGNLLGTFVRLLTGLILITASVLKLAGYDSEMYDFEAIQFPMWASIAIVVLEMWIGLWLLTGIGRWYAHHAALLVYFVFTLTSAYLAVRGTETCNCFGRLVAVSPRMALAIDLLSVGMLLSSRPYSHLSPAVYGRHDSSWGALGVSVAFTIGACFSAFAILVGTHGSCKIAMAILRGDPIIVSPSEYNLGDVPTGDTTEFHVSVVNLSAMDIKIVGGSSSCDCIVSHSLPIVVAPGNPAHVKLSKTASKTPGGFRSAFVLIAENGYEINGVISGTAVVSK